MANKRIKDITDTATAAANDDYLVIDGATNGTRKILSSNVGGGAMHEYIMNSGNTISTGSNGILIRNLYCDASSLTTSDLKDITVYGITDYYCYCLSFNYMNIPAGKTHITIYCQYPAGSQVTAVWHVVLPEKITVTSDAAAM